MELAERSSNSARKGFGCGKTLKGHIIMREHGIAASNWEDLWLGGDANNVASSNKRMFSLGTNPIRSKYCRVCENCGKEFLSWKSFLQHGKCTSGDNDHVNDDMSTEYGQGVKESLKEELLTTKYPIPKEISLKDLIGESDDTEREAFLAELSLDSNQSVKGGSDKKPNDKKKKKKKKKRKTKNLKATYGDEQHVLEKAKVAENEAEKKRFAKQQKELEEEAVRRKIEIEKKKAKLKQLEEEEGRCKLELEEEEAKLAENEAKQKRLAEQQNELEEEGEGEEEAETLEDQLGMILECLAEKYKESS